MKRIYLSFFSFLLLTIVILDIASSPLVSRVVEHYLQNQISTYYRSLVKGIFYMVNIDLNEYSQAQWPERMAAIAPHFGFPIALQRHSEIQLGDSDKHQLDENMIVVKDNGELFHQKVGETDWVVSLGPVEDIDADMIWPKVIIWAALIMVVGLLTLIWAFPFGRKLHHISIAALAFGDGRLETRAVVPRRSALSPLADSFNRMADRIQQLIDTQKELTHAVSHELRTPISRIRFSLEMLNSAGRAADRKHYMAEIIKDVEELEDLVTESLTYARFEHGVPQLERQSRVLEPWLRQIADTVLKNHPQIEYHCRNLLSTPNRAVCLEPRYMGRAVANLLQNAANHARNRINVTVSENGQECLIQVDDDGSGIPEADRRRVFKPYIRLDSSRSRGSGGFGLGLAIVHRVVTWHGGRASVTQAPLGGARFTIRWPGFEQQSHKASTEFEI